MYIYNNRRPLSYAEDYCNSCIKRIPAEDLRPKGWFTYHQGVFLSGMEQVFLQSLDPKLDQYIKDWLNIVLNEDKTAKRIEGHFWVSLNSLDFRQAGILLFRLYEETGDERYLKGIAELVESLKDYPVNSKGGFWHMKEQPNQMWLDGIYMAGPLCAKYAKTTGKQEFFDIVAQQVKLMAFYMTDKETGLMFHGWDESKQSSWADKKTGLSQCIWGRAVGWFAVALVDILENFPSVHVYYGELVEILAKLLKSVSNFQGDKGLWYQVLDKPQRKDNWTEISCSCLLVYAIAKAVRLNYIEPSLVKVATNGFEGVIDSLTYDNDGNVNLNGICIGTCIDEGDYNHYIMRDVITNDLHGGGAFLMMCAEVNKIDL